MTEAWAGSWAEAWVWAGSLAVTEVWSHSWAVAEAWSEAWAGAKARAGVPEPDFRDPGRRRARCFLGGGAL